MGRRRRDGEELRVIGIDERGRVREGLVFHGLSRRQVNNHWQNVAESQQAEPRQNATNMVHQPQLLIARLISRCSEPLIGVAGVHKHHPGDLIRICGRVHTHVEATI